ncbi:hypothetical protein DN752_00680 [Echinicola strongylocentroti]|uniref:Uncharacterized protein n=1 Tax=Echinicola strongylocentroti TaxID=1795355 RepID=A0A2Z4IDB7_9BACT|nr:hypothetical protein DN752_00680 [Echinicola strongylocentroti]
MFLFAFISAVPTELTLLCVIIFGAGGHLHLLYNLPPKADEAGCSVANAYSGFTSTKPTTIHEQIAGTACTIQIN